MLSTLPVEVSVTVIPVTCGYVAGGVNCDFATAAFCTTGTIAAATATTKTPFVPILPILSLGERIGKQEEDTTAAGARRDGLSTRTQSYFLRVITRRYFFRCMLATYTSTDG